MGDQRLDLALQDRNWTMAMRLIEEGQGIRHTDTGWCVLHTAVWKNAPCNICQALLRHLDPNKPEDAGETSAHYAMRFGSSLSLLQTLLDANADPNFRNVFGQTPLVVGVICNCPESLLVCLMEYGGDPKIIDEDGWNAFVWARMCSNEKAMRTLTKTSTLLILRSANAIGRLGRRAWVARMPPDLLRRLATYL